MPIHVVVVMQRKCLFHDISRFGIQGPVQCLQYATNNSIGVGILSSWTGPCGLALQVQVITAKLQRLSKSTQNGLNQFKYQ